MNKFKIKLNNLSDKTAKILSTNQKNLQQLQKNRKTKTVTTELLSILKFSFPIKTKFIDPFNSDLFLQATYRNSINLSHSISL